MNEMSCHVCYRYTCHVIDKARCYNQEFIYFYFIMIQTREEEKSDLQILQAIVKYVILLSSIPVLAFFVSKLVIFDIVLGFEQTQSSVYSAVVAIVVLHLALGHYIYKAYYEAEKAPKSNKAD